MQLLSASYGIQSRMSISPVDWIWYPNEGFYSSQCAQYYGSSRRFDQKGSQLLSVRKLITAFFGSNANYFDGSPLKDIKFPQLSYEVESYIALISNRQTEDYDDRSSAIEIQINIPVKLVRMVEAVVLPRVFRRNDES